MKTETRKETTSISIDDLLGNPTGLSPNMYQYYKGLANNRIVINDEIDSDIIEMAVLPLIDMDNDETVEHIEIFVTTCGGSVYTGFTLVDAINNLKTKTTVHCQGIVASMGILIAMAGTKNPNVKIVCNKHCVGLIHSGSTYLEGSSHAVKDTFKFSERYEEKIKDFILSHTTIDEDTYDLIERQEFWMTSDDMIKYGIVDEIQ